MLVLVLVLMLILVLSGGVRVQGLALVVASERAEGERREVHDMSSLVYFADLVDDRGCEV